MWDNVDDAIMRVNQSVVRHAGKPCYIKHISGRGDVDFLYLHNGEEKAAKLTSPHFDWSPVPTGYTNVEPEAIYVMRKPIRKWKQGLHKDNMAWAPVNPQLHRHGLFEIIRSKEFAACVMRKYPTFTSCMGQVKAKKFRSRAWCPEFAIRGTPIGLCYLEYRGKSVGWFSPEEEIIWGEGCEFLNEIYREARR